MGSKLFCTQFSIKNFSKPIFRIGIFISRQLFCTPFLTYNSLTRTTTFSQPICDMEISTTIFQKIFPPPPTFSCPIFEAKLSCREDWIGENTNEQYHFCSFADVLVRVQKHPFFAARSYSFVFTRVCSHAFVNVKSGLGFTY